MLQSLGCILYALCYFKSPFDSVYERGDSVALAVISANITFPENSPYNDVSVRYEDNLLDYFNFTLLHYMVVVNGPVPCLLLQNMKDLILSMLKSNPMERPYIYSVIESVHDAITNLEGRV